MREKDCILIVDDDEGTRKSLTLLLKRKGFEVEYAETGKEALAIAQGRSINLTLLDIKLPDIEGIQLLAPLTKTNPDMTIIMITGFASVESAVQALNAGASGYITKPIDLDEMLARIKNALDHQHLVIEVRQAEKKIESLAKFPEEDPNPVFRVANDGIPIYANKSSEFIQNEWRLSVGTKVPEFLEKILKEAIESSSRLELEKTVGDKTYLFTIAPIIGQNYVNLYGLDITERKKAEQNLIENELKFRELFDNMSSGVAIYKANEEGNEFFFKNLNRAGERIDNLKRQDVIGKSLLGIFPAIKEFGLFDVLQRVWRTGVPESHPASLYKDARITGWRTNFIYKLPSGEIAAIYDDITEHKRAQEVMKSSEIRYRRFFESVRDGILILDAETGTILDVNPFLIELLGYTHEQFLGKKIWEIGVFRDIAASKDNFKELQEKKYIHFEDLPLETAEGRRIYSEFVSFVYVVEGKNVMQCNIRDITGRKRAEDANALANRKLALMNDVTYQYVQNKITAIRGYAELSKDAKAETERLSFIEKEEHILADIHQLIKNTKEYQEIGVNQPRWISVEKSIRIAVSLVSPNPDISIEIALHGLELYFDSLIEKIFANLIENAVNHGKTTTRITFSCEETPDRLTLICEDDGVGISPDVKARLFDRSVGESIRFGLFFVRESLALSGMTIAETGEFGKGARFEITVPKGMYRFPLG